MIRRILVVRACAIGDFVLNLPALRAIARQYPDARFTLVGYPEILSLARTFIPVDAIHALDSPPWSTLFMRPLAGLDFDAAWVWMLDATIAGHLRESGVGRVFHAPAFSNRCHAADHLLSTAGLPAPDLPDLWMAGSDCVILHPGSGSPSKCWSGFAELAQQVPGAVFLTGPAETQFRASLPSGVPHLKDLPLAAVAEEIRRCRVFVGNDSGITHLAAYWGCPTIALYGPTDPRIWGPVGRRVTVIHKTPLHSISVNDIGDLL